LLVLVGCAQQAELGDAAPLDSKLRTGSKGRAGASPTAEETAAVMGTAFPLALYSRLREQPGNLALAPASIVTALAMAYGGARGETAREMREVLGFEVTDDELHRMLGGVLGRWEELDRDEMELRVANRLFGEHTYEFRPEFLELTERFYGAPLEPCDFRDSWEAARARINGWVAEQTRDRIEGLVPPGGVDRETRLVLVNAIYFMGRWETPFDEESTRPAPFRRGAGDPVDVPTMHREARFGYAELPELGILEMPYAGGELAMLFLLPGTVDGLDRLESQLTEERLSQWIEQTAPREVRVAIPRFRIDPPRPARLGSVLAGMGMPSAFDRRRADFTGIADPPDPADRLYIGEVFHKAFVEVREEGTEAAGATAVVMPRVTSAAPPSPEFRADHPFLFLIRDRRNGAILFLGRVVDPSATPPESTP
jgi:serpin B